MELSDHTFSDNEESPDNAALSHDARSTQPLRRRIRRHLGAVCGIFTVRDGDVFMAVNDADGQVLSSKGIRRAGESRPQRRGHIQPEVSDLTPEDMAKDSFLAAMRRAEPWRAVAMGAIDAGILDVPDHMREYINSGEAKQSLDSWFESLHGHFESDFPKFKDWIESGRKFDEQESDDLLELVNLIDGWVRLIYDTLCEESWDGSGGLND